MRHTDTSIASHQWLFPISALRASPTIAPLERELYDRARGVEFLFRLSASLGLPSSAMFTAATWFHRFYMRYSMEDYHRQDVAASCVFLATKTEECGRKLRDVARVCHAKIAGVDIASIPADSKEVEQCQTAILLTEEVLLEALCFDFVIGSPHAELVDLFDAHEESHLVQDYAWSIAHDTYRTPLCVLYPPQITATASYVLAQRIVDGPLSLSLDARISPLAPSASLPTPPSHKPASPDASRSAIKYFGLNDDELVSVAEALNILIDFYYAQDPQTFPYLGPLFDVRPPTTPFARTRYYLPFSQMVVMPNNLNSIPSSNDVRERTPNSSHGGHTPVQRGAAKVNSPALEKKLTDRLDLS